MVSQPFYYLTAKLQKKAIQSSFLGGKIVFYGYFFNLFNVLPPNTTTKYLQKHPKAFTDALKL